MPKVGTIYKTGRGTSLNSTLRQCASSVPTAGDLVGRDGSGNFIAVADAPTASTDIYGVCMSDPQDGVLNAPGYAAGVSGGPAVAAFGGVGSRAANSSPARQRYIAPIAKEDLFVMTPTSDTNTPGVAYGITRVGAGDYKVNIADTTNAIVRHEGYYEPDVRSGAAVRRIWARFLTAPAG